MSGGLCFLHANPERVRALGQAGGRKNRYRVPDAPILPAEINAKTVRDILAQAVLDVRSNTLAPRAAGALAQLSNTLLRVIQMTELEQRIARLEQAAATGVGTDTTDAAPEGRTNPPPDSELIKSQVEREAAMGTGVADPRSDLL
jgi:hypothetical protein